MEIPGQRADLIFAVQYERLLHQIAVSHMVDRSGQLGQRADHAADQNIGCQDGDNENNGADNKGLHQNLQRSVLNQ
ncbi:hypothetical protein D3C73_1528450 [compost metagenome]